MSMNNMALLMKLLGDLWEYGYVNEVDGHWDYKSTNVGLNSLNEVVVWDLGKKPGTDERYSLGDPSSIEKLRAEVEKRIAEHDNED